MDFVSRVALSAADGASLGTADIRVNHPAEVEGLRIFQYGYGWAPVITIADGDRTLFDGPVVFTQDPAPEGVGQLAMPWNGVVKLPSLDPQVGMQVVLWPDPRVPAVVPGEPVADDRGTRPVHARSGVPGAADGPVAARPRHRHDAEWNHVLVGQGQTKTLGEDGAGGTLTVSFPELRQYSVFQVSRDRGVWIVLTGAILVLLGLLPALYTSRAQGVGARRARRRRLGAEGRRIRAAAQGAVRGRVREHPGRAGAGLRRAGAGT